MSGGRLIVLDRAGRDAKQYALAEGLATLGSDLACDIRLMLPAVSPHHATVMVQANQTVVQSVSEGVTLLNDVPVSVAVLRHGDIISMGGRALRWEYSQPQHRNLSKAQPALVAINKTRGKGKGHRSRSSDPVFHNTPVHNGRSSMPASSMKQVAIVQPQRRDLREGELNCAPELTESSQVENTENESNPETTTRKSTRPSQKSLQANTKASEWIESRKSSRPPITPQRTRNTLNTSDLQPRSKSATRPTTQRETQMRSKSLALRHLENKVKARATLTPRQTQSRSKPIEETPKRENKPVTRATLTPRETRDVRSRSSAVQPIDAQEESTPGIQKDLTLRNAELEPTPHTPIVTNTAILATPKQPQSSTKPLGATPLHLRNEEKSANRAPLTSRESRVRSSASSTPMSGLTNTRKVPPKSTRESRKSSLIPLQSKSVTQLTITPTEAHETMRSSILVEKSTFTPLNRSRSMLPRPTPSDGPYSSKSRILSRSRLTSTPMRTQAKSSNRPTMTPLLEKRVLPPRARTLTPRAQAFAINKSSVTPLRTWRDTSLRSTVLRRTHRPVKIQAPTFIDHTKQAAIMLMTRHTKSKSPNVPSVVVTKPSPVRKSLKRSSRSPRDSLVKRVNISELNRTKELSPRRSVSCPSARKSAMKSTLKDPKSARKIESIKFDLSNLEKDNNSDQFRSSVVTVDTTNRSFDAVSSVQYGTPSPRRSINSRSSRIIEKTLGSPMTLVDRTETAIITSPRSRSSRGGLIVQKALEETLKTQTDVSGQTNLTRTLSPRAETYSIVDLVSRDSNATDYNTIDSTPFGTPRSHRKTRSFDAALPSSTPYKMPRNQSMKDDSVSGNVESPEIITPQNNENNKPVASTKVSKRSRSKSRLNDSDLFLLEDEDSPRTSKRADKSATTSFDISHLKRKLSQSLTESDEESEKIEINALSSAPKASLSNIRVKQLFAKSPQNDLRNISGVKTLFQSKKKQKTPKNTLEDVRGVKRLFRVKEKTPKNTLENVSGVKALFKRSPRNDLRVSGVKDALQLRSPRNDLTDVRGVRRLYRLEKERYSSNVSGVQEIFKENSDLDTTFDLLMGKPPLRTYKAASAQKMKPKSKIRKAKSLYDSTSIHPEHWLKKNEITVYNEKNLPLKKRSLKSVKSTPVKANVTLNSTELCQISPINKPASVNTVGTSQLDDHSFDISVNNSSTSLGKTTRSRQGRSALKNSTFTIKDIITEESPSTSLVIHKKSPVLKPVRKTRQKRVQEESESTQNQQILEPKDQKASETKMTRRKVKKSALETVPTLVPRSTRSKAKSPTKSLAKRVSIVIKTPISRNTRKGKVTVKEQNKTVENSKAPTKNKEIPTLKDKARVLTKQTPKRTRTRRVSIVVPAKTPLASAKKTRGRIAAANKEIAQTKEKKAAQAQDPAATKPTRKGKATRVNPAENEDLEKPKRGRKIQVEKKIPEVDVTHLGDVKTRAKINVKPDTMKATKKTQAKGKEQAQAPVVLPKTSRKRKSPDTTTAAKEDIEKPKRGRKKATVTATTTQSEVKTRAKANIQASSSTEAKKVSLSKSKKVAAKETVAPSTSRKRKSPDVTPSKEETSVSAKRRKATEKTAPSRATRSKAVSVPESPKPKTRGRKR